MLQSPVSRVSPAVPSSIDDPHASTNSDDTSQNLPNPLTPQSPPDQSPDPDPNPISHDLTPRQLAAIDLMLTGNTDLKIAELLQINRRTLYDWRTHNPRFQQHLNHRREELFGGKLGLFLSALSTSLQTLTQQAAHPYADVSHRAARTILIASRLGQHLYNLTNPNKTAPPPESTPAQSHHQHRRCTDETQDRKLTASADQATQSPPRTTPQSPPAPVYSLPGPDHSRSHGPTPAPSYPTESSNPASPPAANSRRR